MKHFLLRNKNNIEYTYIMDIWKKKKNSSVKLGEVSKIIKYAYLVSLLASVSNKTRVFQGPDASNQTFTNPIILHQKHSLYQPGTL